MLWVLLDLAIAFVAVVGLGLVLLQLWRRVKAFGRAVSDAGSSVAEASAGLADAQADRPDGRRVV